MHNKHISLNWIILLLAVTLCPRIAFTSDLPPDWQAPTITKAEIKDGMVYVEWKPYSPEVQKATWRSRLEASYDRPRGFFKSVKELKKDDTSAIIELKELGKHSVISLRITSWAGGTEGGRGRGRAMAMRNSFKNGTIYQLVDKSVKQPGEVYDLEGEVVTDKSGKSVIRLSWKQKPADMKTKTFNICINEPISTTRESNNNPDPDKPRYSALNKQSIGIVMSQNRHSSIYGFT